ncbi:MAG: class I SAM-dependent methyltransferase [Halioglobus sp.]
MFGVVWDSSQVLARVMIDFDIDGKRILELGCGMALSSLLLNRRGGDITATDYHPDVAAYLQINTGLNEDNDIPYFRADWDKPEINHGPFDLIIASDVLYDRSKLVSLARFIQNHAQPRCEIVMVDPGRKLKLKGPFSHLMAEYGFALQQEKAEDSSYLAKPFTGSIMKYSRS